MTSDPLLQPLALKHLVLRNRILSTAHEPAYTEDGMPKERYRLYHREKAKGGIALTMIGGSSVVAPDSPQAFGNIVLYRDEVVRWLRELADDVHAHGAAVMIQITHLGRRTSWSKEDWLPVIAPSPIREPAHRAFPKAAEDFDLARIKAAYADAAERCQAAGLDGLEFEMYGHLLDQFWSPATNKRDDEYGGTLENRMRFSLEVLDAVRERVGRDFIVGARLVCDEDWDRGLIARGRHRNRAAPRRDRPHRLPQRHSRPYRHRRGTAGSHSGRWARARRRISTSPARSAARLACRCSTRRASRTWRRRATPSPRVSSTWWA